MAKKKKNFKKVEENKKGFKNPSETIWGKALVWLILIGMVGGAIVGLIIAIIEMSN